jgi:hypothetical protein
MTVLLNTDESKEAYAALRAKYDAISQRWTAEEKTRDATHQAAYAARTGRTA